MAFVRSMKNLKEMKTHFGNSELEKFLQNEISKAAFDSEYDECRLSPHHLKLLVFTVGSSSLGPTLYLIPIDFTWINSIRSLYQF